MTTAGTALYSTPTLMDTRCACKCIQMDVMLVKVHMSQCTCLSVHLHDAWGLR